MVRPKGQRCGAFASTGDSRLLSTRNRAAPLELNGAARRDHRTERFTERVFVNSGGIRGVTDRQAGAAAELDVEVAKHGSRCGICTHHGFDRLAAVEGRC